MTDVPIDLDAAQTEWSNMEQSELRAGRKMAEILFGSTLVRAAIEGTVTE